MLASVAEQASLSLTWPETPEDTFSHDEAQFDVCLPGDFNSHTQNDSDYMSRLVTKPTKWHVRPAKASAQSDQSLRCPHEESLDP